MVTSWRDQVKVHSAADLFAGTSDGEIEELAQNIERTCFELRHPIVFWTSTREIIRRKIPQSTEIYPLDGRNRLEPLCRLIDRDRDDDASPLSDYILTAKSSRPLERHRRTNCAATYKRGDHHLGCDGHSRPPSEPFSIVLLKRMSAAVAMASFISASVAPAAFAALVVA